MTEQPRNRTGWRRPLSRQGWSLVLSAIVALALSLAFSSAQAAGSTRASGATAGQVPGATARQVPGVVAQGGSLAVTPDSEYGCPPWLGFPYVPCHPKPPCHHDGCHPKPPCHHDGCHPRPPCHQCPTPPVCNAGGGPNVAYTAMPTDVLRCPNLPSLGFEATGTSEFGDEVGLAATGSGTLSSLRVMFASYGCSQSGHWNTRDCVTTPGATFTHPITANVYAVDNTGPTPRPGALLATTTQTFTISYRPSADPANCAGPDAGMWFNPAVGACESKIRQLLTFTFPGTATPLPSQVIWTVAFNTTHYGYSPIGVNTDCFRSNPGCGYDSLNVGTRTFPNAPYAGTDVDPNGAFLNSAIPSSYCDGGAGGTGTLRLDTAPTDCWADYKPLGEIRTA
ncbi:hypothetical protein FNH05_29640 [Amycolatopsis rhizosphaerae]|uniref:Uncharacterized protein n=1 Tax=Amycolatopsis rhizosphaerae TaxID=2053003 RepID=A0A558B0M6_9PSEU|nr:hypothetical protein [Amycolatopsis rhizosphaerae]TVT30043.1 hypothetical protein FNH05_29640 [Amycolatopsis rhizosphaerae]